MIPILTPKILAAKITRKASYMNTRYPSAFVSPTDLSTPYSQIFSLMLAVVAMSRTKNTMISEIMPITTIKRLKISVTLPKESTIELTSTMYYVLVIYYLSPLIIYYFRSDVMFELKLISSLYLGML